MKRTIRRAPFLIAAGLLLLAAAIVSSRPDFLERFERITFDMRARTALRFSPPVASNLGFVYIDEETLKQVRSGPLGFRYGLYWPRSVYARLLEELSAQGAKAIGLDVVFGELRLDHPAVLMTDGSMVESDDLFANTLRGSSNAILAVSKDLQPPALFLTNAPFVGDISTEKDSDGVLRRFRPFHLIRQWHWAFKKLEADPDYGVDLRNAVVEPGKIILPRTGLDAIEIPLDTEGKFDLADFGGENLPASVSRKQEPFTEKRVWHMGVVLAAIELGLDLDHAQVDIPNRRLVLSGSGARREIPVDGDGYTYIDWCVPPDHGALFRQPMHALLAQNRDRLDGNSDLPHLWEGKLTVVGSSALANDLTDRGATPLRKDTLLVSKHWNVANMIVENRFIRRASGSLELGLVLLLVAVAAASSWTLRPPLALLAAAAILVLYILAAFLQYVLARVWLPLVLPVLMAFITQSCLLTYRVVFEQSERKRVKAVFSKMVSPKIVAELLNSERLSLGGVRREVTVYFADIRGFTEFTDTSQELVSQHVEAKKLSGEAAESCYNDQARDALDTVNLYLGAVANLIVGNHGTLDKFIGDCVMAFWGAPTPNAYHATACVRAAISAQRAIYDLNAQRLQENKRRNQENSVRRAQGQQLLPLLPVLSVGTGINTGMAVAGLMGSSESESLSYTVFGREVNLASRLESASGSGRILISQTTYQHLLRDDPALAATCLPLEPIKVKGFKNAIPVFEVPWQAEENLSQPRAPQETPRTSEVSSVPKV